MQRRYLDWWPAAAVTVVTAFLVALDLDDTSVHRYWSRHSFTASVLSGVLVLLLTLLIVDRVTRTRQLRNQSRAIAAQAAIILAQAERAADLVPRATASDQDRDQASDELRTYTQMLLVSAPVLIDANTSRAFLETAQRVAAEIFRALHAPDPGGSKRPQPRVDDAMNDLRQAGAPLLAVLNREQLNAVTSDDPDASASEVQMSASRSGTSP